jgi:hypothetical protein
MGVMVSLSANAAVSKKIEVGRLSLYPLEPFTAEQPDKERHYRVDITKALADLNPDGIAYVELRIIDRLKGKSLKDGEVKIGDVLIVRQ